MHLRNQWRFRLSMPPAERRIQNSKSKSPENVITPVESDHVYAVVGPSCGMWKLSPRVDGEACEEERENVYAAVGSNPSSTKPCDRDAGQPEVVFNPDMDYRNPLPAQKVSDMKHKTSSSSSKIPRYSSRVPTSASFDRRVDSTKESPYDVLRHPDYYMSKNRIGSSDKVGGERRIKGHAEESTKGGSVDVLVGQATGENASDERPALDEGSTYEKLNYSQGEYDHGGVRPRSSTEKRNPANKQLPSESLDDDKEPLYDLVGYGSSVATPSLPDVEGFSELDDVFNPEADYTSSSSAREHADSKYKNASVSPTPVDEPIDINGQDPNDVLKQVKDRPKKKLGGLSETGGERRI